MTAPHRHIWLIVAAMLALAGCGDGANSGADAPEQSRSTSTEDAAAQVREVDVDDAATRAARGEILLVDVREPDEWDAGHASTAMHVPLADVGDRIDLLRQRADSRPIWFICRSGNRSAQAAAIAIEHGIKDVASVRGGMGAWHDAGHPMVPRGAIVA